MNLEFKTAYKTESVGDYGNLGIEIRLAECGEPSEAVRTLLYKCGGELQEAILLDRAKNDPEGIAACKQWETDLRACFGDEAIYIQRIHNQYAGDGSVGINRPWFRVTTRRGHIVIGPQSRVIFISWTETDIPGSEALFADEDVTKGTYSIDAWGIGNARRYVSVLLNSETREELDRRQRAAKGEI